MVEKHAYLIICHHEPLLLQTLVTLIDDVRNDIFIAIDSKSEAGIFHDVKATKSKLVFTKQRDNRWGSVRQVETELMLFEMASNVNHYSYYHLLSGQDLPIKSQDYIHDFCDRLQGKQFVGFAPDTPKVYKEIEIKTRYYYLFQLHFRCKGIFTRYAVWSVQKINIALQKIIGIRRKYPFELKKGCNWVSVTDDFVRYLLTKKRQILQTFNHTFCSDEIFLQTVLWNSPYRNDIYDVNDEYGSCLRYIDWKRGKPYTFTMNDYAKLMGGGELLVCQEIFFRPL